ncbi:DUF4435 domain-containing protein [Acinetobacter baumannii]|uniref:DUF4435 domain-containing protein n=1 Tax=Acinetobacter baumannii TaxID=470 RepID=UPI0022201DB4|nr:DUF4435 domain-containing protein [Acinetobacter baumannii]MCW1386427.1 DUF4435 domain-containing protein [Acinetobacter baumannii]
MSKPTPFTVPVIIATIKNAKSGKYVVVEGVDDIVVYRNLITFYQTKGIKVLAAGGRTKVLEVFDALNGTTDLNKAIFIVDQDSWIFSGIPAQYQHQRIICTSGYSIENDVYVDKQLDLLMQGTAVFIPFQSELHVYLKWFSLAITRFCTNGNANGEKLDIHPEAFFSCVTTTQNYCSLKSNEVFPQQVYNDLLINYGLKFRGKCLLPLAIRALGKRPNQPKYNSSTIMEETAITGRGTHLNRIFAEVGQLA